MPPTDVAGWAKGPRQDQTFPGGASFEEAHPSSGKAFCGEEALGGPLERKEVQTAEK
jgi:hypothetical protein